MERANEALFYVGTYNSENEKAIQLCALSLLSGGNENS